MSEPWYASGLRFKCTECGKCCTGAPGYVFVSQEEMQKIADHLGLSFEEFCKTHIRQVGQRYSLLEDPKSYDCIFLKEGKCSVYEVRPTQCRTFPWWLGNLKSKKDWKEAARTCEGISEEAPLVSLGTIQEQLTDGEKEDIG